jgi:prolyl-tRNA editing enzyme YbaK/EbsC (Cys-tRNA(Pro) deacylase)
MNYHPVTQKILNLLKQNNIRFEIFHHQPAITSMEASKVRNGYSISQGTKAMIVKLIKNTGNSLFIMLVLPGNRRFNNKKVKQLMKTKDIRLATQDEISQITDGIQVGGIPPFGNLFDLSVFADPSIFLNEKIIFSAGDRCVSISIKSQDYVSLVKPKFISFTT